jgi:hypothetical protein
MGETVRYSGAHTYTVLCVHGADCESWTNRGGGGGGGQTVAVAVVVAVTVMVKIILTVALIW